MEKKEATCLSPLLQDHWFEEEEEGGGGGEESHHEDATAFACHGPGARGRPAIDDHGRERDDGVSVDVEDAV